MQSSISLEEDKTKNPDISIFSEKKQKGRDVNEAFEESVGPLSLLITSSVIVIRYAQKFWHLKSSVDWRDFHSLLTFQSLMIEGMEVLQT